MSASNCLLTVAHHGLRKLALVILFGEFFFRMQVPVGLHVLLDLLQIHEAEHVNCFRYQLLGRWVILSLLALSSSFWCPVGAWIGVCCRGSWWASWWDGCWCLDNHVESILLRLKLELIKWKHAQREFRTENALKGEHFSACVSLEHIQAKLFPLFVLLNLLLCHLLHCRGTAMTHSTSAVDITSRVTTRSHWTARRASKRGAIEHPHLLF